MANSKLAEISYQSALHLVTFGLFAVFIWILASILGQGFDGLSYQFLTQQPELAGRQGGIWPILVSTIWIVGLAVCFATPFGILSGLVFSAKLTRDTWLRRSASHFVDILASVPSIVFGLFGNLFFGELLGFGYSILSGSLTLACMILPILIRMSEDVFASIPKAQIDGALGLGLAKWRVFLHIMLPGSITHLLTAMILATARALAETAALLFTSGYSLRQPESWFDSGRTLSIHIYDLAVNLSGGNQNAYRSACALLALLLLINCSVYVFRKYWRERLGKSVIHS